MGTAGPRAQGFVVCEPRGAGQATLTAHPGPVLPPLDRSLPIRVGAQPGRRKEAACHPPGSGCGIPGYKPSRSPVLRPRARLLPPRPPGGGPGSQGWSWGGDPRLERCARGGGGSGFWAVPKAPNPPAWGSRVQGAKAAPGWRQTGARWSARATNPVQPKAAAAARATANWSRERASDRSGLGTCGQRGGIRSPVTRPADWLLGLATPPPGGGSPGLCTPPRPRGQLRLVRWPSLKSCPNSPLAAS